MAGFNVLNFNNDSVSIGHDSNGSANNQYTPYSGFWYSHFTDGDPFKKDLTLTYNKARQAAITGEILEIVGGAEALNG